MSIDLIILGARTPFFNSADIKGFLNGVILFAYLAVSIQLPFCRLIFSTTLFCIFVNFVDMFHSKMT